MIETVRDGRLNLINKSEHSIIKYSPKIPEKIFIRDNIKIVTFLNPLSFQTQKRYKEVIRSFFALYEGFKIEDIKSEHIENYLTSELKQKKCRQNQRLVELAKF